MRSLTNGQKDLRIIDIAELFVLLEDEHGLYQRQGTGEGGHEPQVVVDIHALFEVVLLEHVGPRPFHLVTYTAYITAEPIAIKSPMRAFLVKPLFP